jgi:alcohol dehydrogenase class IV
MTEDSYLGLRKFVAPEVIFGSDALMLIGQYSKKYGAKQALIVTDPGVTTAGWTKKVVESLAEEGILSHVFSEVTPNPRELEVMSGAEFYKDHRCDCIIAIGGGSPMDCAKGIGIVSTNKKHILEFEGIDHVSVPVPPLLCIPTTGGTSADVSQFSIITDTQEKTKIAIISKAIVPDVALIDPNTLTTMDAYLTACTGLDALVHAIEAYVSNASSPITDLHALQAIRLLSENLPASIQDLKNIELRSRVMMGSFHAGLAFSNASLGAVHAMAHSLGGLLDLPHGECNAMLLPHVMSFNFETQVERYKTIGSTLGIEFAKMNANEIKNSLLTTVNQLRRSAGVKETLGSRGVKQSDIPELAKRAYADACMVTNPRKANQKDLEVIYAEAL